MKKTEEKEDKKINNKIKKKTTTKKSSDEKTAVNMRISKKDREFEDKKNELIKKQNEYNKDIAKQYLLDETLIEEKNKKIEKEIKEQEKVTSVFKIIRILVILIVITLICSMLYLNKEKYSIKNILNYYKRKELIASVRDAKERKTELEMEAIKRENSFIKEAIETNLTEEKEKELKEKYSIDNFKKHLIKGKIYINELDQIEDNYFLIGDDKIQVKKPEELFEIEYLKKKKEEQKNVLSAIDKGKPSIIFTNKGIYNKNGELVVGVNNKKAQNFDGFVDGNSNPIVVGIDKKDGDITKNIKMSGIDLNNLEINKTYTIKYVLENSNKEKDEKILKIFTIDVGVKR